MPDPTQPVPGPTREQIHGAVCEVIGKHHDRWDLSALITDAIEALLPARPSPTDDDLSELRRLVTEYDAPSSTAEDLDAIVEAREKLAEAVPGLLAEIERLRAHQGTT